MFEKIYSYGRYDVVAEKEGDSLLFIHIIGNDMLKEGDYYIGKMGLQYEIHCLPETADSRFQDKDYTKAWLEGFDAKKILYSSNFKYGVPPIPKQIQKYLNTLQW